jgi:hypothetical protein
LKICRYAVAEVFPSSGGVAGIKNMRVPTSGENGSEIILETVTRKNDSFGTGFKCNFLCLIWQTVVLTRLFFSIFLWTQQLVKKILKSLSL